MEYIKIGAIANTHGLKGTLKIKSFTDFKEERYKKGHTLYIFFKGEYIPVTIANVKTVKGLELFFSIDDIHEIKEEDTFYYTDLIGCEVITDTTIGIVIDIREYPQGEYLVIDTDQKKNVLVPFLKQFVNKVDTKNHKIYITEWEGLL